MIPQSTRNSRGICEILSTQQGMKYYIFHYIYYWKQPSIKTDWVGVDRREDIMRFNGLGYWRIMYASIASISSTIRNTFHWNYIWISNISIQYNVSRIVVCKMATNSYRHHCFEVLNILGDVIKLKHFPRYWPFVMGIHRWIPLMKASDAALWRFLWSAPEQTLE